MAQNWLWEPSPFQWSADGGASWHPSTVPDRSREVREWQDLVTLGDRALVIADTQSSGGPAGPPFIWVTGNGGRTFTAAEGVADGVLSGQVRAMVAHQDGLVAFGVVLVQSATGPTVEPTRWEIDRRRPDMDSNPPHGERAPGTVPGIGRRRRRRPRGRHDDRDTLC